MRVTSRVQRSSNKSIDKVVSEFHVSCRSRSFLQGSVDESGQIVFGFKSSNATSLGDSGDSAHSKCLKEAESSSGSVASTSCESASSSDDDASFSYPPTDKNSYDDVSASSFCWDVAQNDQERAQLRTVLTSLSESEKEEAARSVYRYDQLVLEQGNKMSQQELEVYRDLAVQRMYQRYYVSSNMNHKSALKQLRSTLKFRREQKSNELRHCFKVSPEGGNSCCSAQDAQQLRHKVEHFVGPLGRTYVRGYDKEGNAILHFIFKNSPEHIKSGDISGFVEAHDYMLEKAIACSERRSNGKNGRVTMTFDFNEFKLWHVTPGMMKDLFLLFMFHQPERLHRGYIIDAPFVFRALLKTIMPLLKQDLRDRFVLVGKKERHDLISGLIDKDQAMPYQRDDGELTHPVNMQAFHYDLPFDRVYDE